MIKATEGTSYVNPWLEKDAHGARAQGFDVGYYHYAHPGISLAEEQADFLLKTIEGLPRDLGIANDLEITEGLSWVDLQAWGRSFLTRVPESVKQRVTYLDESFASSLPGLANDFPIWLAAWGAHPPRRDVWAWQKGAENLGWDTFDVGVFYG
jgi:lysozyme